jgi:chlorobactene glucosyltransferase
MTDQLWIDHLGGIVVFLAILLLISFFNLLTLKRLGQFPTPAACPRVSLLVPARNEARNIETCARSLLSQDYPDFEVIVLDDESTDGTGEILARAAAQDARLRVIHGQPLPAGWLGKNWACKQLSQAADGDYLLFTDADTRHDPAMLREAIAAATASKADLLSGMPQQEVKTWSEQLLVPLLAWSFMAFIPIALAERVRAAFLSVSIGQFLLFRRSAYAAIRGHEAVRDKVVEDFELARRIKQAGLQWRLLTPRPAFTAACITTSAKC